MQKNSLLNTILLIIFTLCILQIVQATNTPSNCSDATLVLNTDPSTITVGGTVSLTVTSYDIPLLLSSYNVALFANGNLIRTAYNQNFSILGQWPFVYTFSNVPISAPVTDFYVRIYQNFLIYFPIVEIYSNHLNVTALQGSTNLTIDRSQGGGSAITSSNVQPLLSMILTVDPAPPAGATVLDNERLNCTTFFDGVFQQSAQTAMLQRRDAATYTQDCSLPGLFSPGINVTVLVEYPFNSTGDGIYAPASILVSFLSKSQFNYTASDVTVSYPSNTNRALVHHTTTASKTKSSEKVANAKKAKKAEKKNDRRRRSAFA